MKKHRCLTVLQGSSFVPLFPVVPYLSPELLSLFLEGFCLSPELLSLSSELLSLSPEPPA